MKIQQRTWDDFWGELFLVRFHLDNPERWPSRERKAEFLANTAPIDTNSDILELGCGDGLLSICLGRQGHRVTAIDRISSVIELARKDDNTKNVSLVAGDLKQVMFDADSYDHVILLDTIGLMSREDDLGLMKRVHGWLRSDGAFTLDCPREPKQPASSWTKDFTDGTLSVETAYDSTTRLLHIDPKFTRADGTIISLFDPYDGQHQREGIVRYYYPEQELADMLRESGFEVSMKPHWNDDSYVLLIARRS